MSLRGQMSTFNLHAGLRLYRLTPRISKILLHGCLSFAWPRQCCHLVNSGPASAFSCSPASLPSRSISSSVYAPSLPRAAHTAASHYHRLLTWGMTLQLH